MGEARLRTKLKFSFAHSLHLRTKKHDICAQIIVDICAQFCNKQIIRLPLPLATYKIQNTKVIL